MRRPMLLVTLALVGLLVTAPAIQAAGPASAFTGHWRGTDPGDGSTEDLYISGGSQIQILYTDDVASAACRGLVDQAFTAVLVGRADGYDLNATIKVAKCGLVNVHFNGYGISWTYDPETDTLSNGAEVFTRV